LLHPSFGVKKRHFTAGASGKLQHGKAFHRNF
jgi:hypothetical protein